MTFAPFHSHSLPVLTATLVACAWGPLSACSSSSSSPPPSGSPDARADSRPVTTHDGGVHDSGTHAEAGGGTDSAAEAGPTCATALPEPATDLYVDQTYAGGASNGTTACPFVTIVDAVNRAAALSALQTIHVKGNSSQPLVYAEKTAVQLPFGVNLSGDGPGATIIKADGPCLTTTCAVLVQGSSTLSGVQVTDATGNGVVTQQGGGVPSLQNVTITGSGLDGLYSVKDVILGPSFQSLSNKQAGVHSTGDATTAGLEFTGTGNAASMNGTHGVFVEGTAALAMDGSLTTSGNGQNGVSIEGTSVTGSPATHMVNALTAKNNQRAGLSVLHGLPVDITQSKLEGNGVMGLYYDFATSPVANLNLQDGAPDNNFGSGTSTANNKSAGIFLCNASGTVPAGSNFWSACPPTTATATNCTATPAAYADVVLAPTAGATVDANNCQVGQ